MGERLLDRLEALVGQWKAEAHGYETPHGTDPVLAEHCATIEHAALELEYHLREARRAEARGMAALAEELREIDKRMPCRACDGTGLVPKEAPTDAR